MSVRLFVRPHRNNLAANERIFMKFDILVFFGKVCREKKNHVSLKSVKNNGYFTCTDDKILPPPQKKNLKKIKNPGNKI